MKNKLWTSFILFLIFFAICFFGLRYNSNLENITIHGEHITSPIVSTFVAMATSLFVALILTLVVVLLTFILFGVGIFIAIILGIVGLHLFLPATVFFLPFLLLCFIPVVLYRLLQKRKNQSSSVVSEYS